MITKVTPTPSAAIAAGGGIVVVNWTGGTAPFQVQCRASLTAPWQDVAGTTSGLTQTNILLQPAAFYRIAGVAATIAASPDKTAPSIPTNLAATVVSSSQINLAWNASTDTGTGATGVKGYNVYRNGIFLKQILAPSTVASDTGLIPSTAYTYAISAVDNAYNQSAASNSVSATTLSTCPFAIAPLSATFPANGGSGGVSVTDNNGCPWVATSSVPWLTITSGSSGNGNLSLNYSVAQNASTNSHIGSMSIAGQTFTVTQAGATVDTTVPTVNLTAPAAASTVSNTITVSASASDNVGVTKVEFYCDSSTLLATSTNSPYNAPCNTTTMANGSHSFYAKAYDAAGNVASSVSSTVTVSNGVPVPPGQYLWSRQVTNLAPAGFSVVAATAVDSAGNVVAAGSLNGTVNLGGGSVATAGRTDIFVTKTSSGGAYLWSRHFGGVNDDQAFGVAVDSAGNVYVIGQFSGTVDFGFRAVTAANPAIFLLKLSAQGAPVWCKQFGGATGVNDGLAVAVDSHDNVLITGYYGYFGSGVDFGLGTLTSAGGRNIFVAKYGSDGTALWTKGVGGGSSDMDSGTSIAVDRRDDSVLLTGNFSGTLNFGGGNLSSAGGLDIFLAKYSSTGGYVWAQRFGDIYDDYADGVAVDPNGNIALDGNFRGNVNFGTGTLAYHGSADMFVARFTAAGGCLWSKNFGSPYGGDALYAVATDANGSVIVTGTVLGNLDFGGGILWGLAGGLSQNVLVMKYSGTGAYVWGYRYASATPVDAGNSVSTDQSGNVIAGGYFQGTINPGGGNLISATSVNDAFVTKLAP